MGTVTAVINNAPTIDVELLATCLCRNINKHKVDLRAVSKDTGDIESILLCLLPAQVETCPPRLGKDCPITILLEENHTNVRVEEEPFSFVSLFDASNPDVMKLQTFAAACAVLLIAFIQLLRCVTFMLLL